MAFGLGRSGVTFGLGWSGVLSSLSACTGPHGRTGLTGLKSASAVSLVTSSDVLQTSTPSIRLVISRRASPLDDDSFIVTMISRDGGSRLKYLTLSAKKKRRATPVEQPPLKPVQNRWTQPSSTWQATSACRSSLKCRIAQSPLLARQSELCLALRMRFTRCCRGHNFCLQPVATCLQRQNES